MTAPPSTDVPVVGLRQPCPCGSGRRYKACHGRSDDRRATRKEPVRRPFAGLPGECDWVAMRELVPAATATVALSDATLKASSRPVLIVTALPFGWPAYVRSDDTALVALQTSGSFGDPASDVAAALVAACSAQRPEQASSSGFPVAPEAPAEVPLSDLLDTAGAFRVSVHSGFSYWLAEGEDDEKLITAVEQSSDSLVPTVRLSGVEAAYWCQIGDRRHLRWVQPHDEDALLDALARLHVTGEDRLGESTRFVGSFRASGLLVPVWDLPADMSADDVEKPAAAYAERLADALAIPKPLTTEERGARAGLQNRQVTLR